jgi:SAM-dependent methyltransferase
VQGDILNFPEKVDDFDFIVSWLSFLHISDRSSLLKKCNIILKPGGKIYIEDFYQRNEMSLEEKKVLSIDICCDYLPTGDQYKKQLMKNDFINIELNDKTKEWTTYVRERYEKFVKDRRRQIEIHNIPIVEDLEDFYKKMAWLFQNGNLGGLRIIADKK